MISFDVHRVAPAPNRRRLNGHVDGSSNNRLYMGDGVHYVYIWIGTPPQRVSVIVDTGSHHTAFPCKGCKCGVHEDPPFDPIKSSSSRVLSCHGQQCIIQQAYTEGSSWRAYAVKDHLYVGDITTNEHQLPPSSSSYSILFEFGCQISETGLFRTQGVDGIMGLSALPDTLPMQLMKQNVTKSTTFSLCLSNHGGALTLGGINHKLHQQYDSNGSGYNSSSSSRVDDIKYVKLMNSDSGWFTVKLLDILIVGSDGSSKSLGVDKSVYNSNKGVIIDSGTTDTYLPGNVLLSDSPSLPTIVFVMEGVDGKAVHVSMPPTSYIEVDRNSNDKQQQQQYGYNRIYLTEPSGAVLGANFMKHYDVIFDSQRKQVGFAKSSCSLYNDSSAISDTDSGRSIVYDRQVAIDKNVKLIFNSLANSNCSVTLTKSCSATCDFPSLAATASSTGIYTNTSISVAVTAVAGSQVWSSTCTGIKMVPCEMKCGDLANDVYIERHCPSTPWSSCSANCTQTRVVSQKNTNCTMMTESRRCSYDLCESADSRRGDVAISFDMKLSSGYITWCSYYAEQIVTGIEQVFHPLNHSVTVDLSVKRSSSSISSIDVTALLHATAPNGVDAEVLQGSMLASINHRQFPALLASCLNPPYSPNRWLSQDQLRVIGAAAVAPHSSTVSSGSIGSNGSTGGNADSIDRALLVSVLLFVAFIYSIYCWYKSCCHQLKKNKR